MRVILATVVLAFIFTLGASLDMPHRFEAQSSNSLQLQSTGSSDRSWIDASNQYTNKLLAVEFKHRPEFASREGLSEYDTKISQPSWADVDERRKETAEVLQTLKATAGDRQLRQVEQDLQIMIRRVELEFKQEDFERGHEVPFFNASAEVFQGVQFLLDEQT